MFTRAEADQALANIRRHLGGTTELNVGLNTEVMTDLVKLGGFYVEGGTRSQRVP